MYRQGDVLLVPVAEIPEDAVEVKAVDGVHVLALGESTGHAHTMTAQTTSFWRTPGGQSFLRVLTETPLIHQEHGVIPVAPVIYLVTPQAEYDPTVEARRVTD